MAAAGCDVLDRAGLRQVDPAAQGGSDTDATVRHFRCLASTAPIGSDGTRVGQNLQCAPVLPCDGPFFRAGAVRYNKTFVHAKFEVNPSTWAASRTVDVSRFRVGGRCGGPPRPPHPPPPPRYIHTQRSGEGSWWWFWWSW